LIELDWVDWITQCQGKCLILNLFNYATESTTHFFNAKVYAGNHVNRISPRKELRGRRW